MKRNSFTLVEVMIVTAIIMLLSAIVIPNLLRIKIDTNERSAVAAAKGIYMAAKNFASANAGRFPQNLAALGELGRPYIDSSLATTTSVSGEKSGYYFNYTPLGNPPTGFWLSVEPVTPGTRVNFYYIDEKGLICKGSEVAIFHAPEGLLCPANFNPAQ